MKNEVNIAIFGLSLSALDELKNKIRLMLPNNIQINWTNIAEPNLDCIMINDIFFSSPNIQNLIQNKNLNYLRLIKNEDKGGIIENDVLFIPLNGVSALNQWIRHHVLHDLATQHSLSYTTNVAPDVKHTSQQVLAENLQQNTITTTQYQQANNAITIPTVEANYSPISIKILNEIFDSKNGNIQLFDAAGKIAIAQANTERIWLFNDKKILDSSLNYTYATSQDIKDCQNLPVIDLRLWLFNLAWNSFKVIKYDISPQKYYKLLFWPQPAHRKDRKDIIRMSSCFAKGASIDQVANHLKISHVLIERYISSCFASHLITEIPAEQAKLIKFAIPEQQATPKQAEQAGIVKSFFGRLRKKLGL